MTEEFINLYIDNSHKRIVELMKSELLLLTRLNIAENLAAAMQERVAKLEAEIAELIDRQTVLPAEE